MQEKARRREILTLYNQGFTQAEIAEKLRVSVKTVSRDWKRLHGYVEHLRFQEQMKIEQVLHECLEKVPSGMRLQLLGALINARGSKRERKLFDALLRGDISNLKRLARRVRGT
jgi:uncharacterized protein YjcR